MSFELQHVDDKAAAVRSIMPPYLVLRDFLDEATVAGLLSHALAHEAEFAPTQTGHGVRSEIRVSLGLRNLGPFRSILRFKVLDLVSALVAKLHATPVQAPKLELQLVAHKDAAFYKRHIDTQTASDRARIRVLSAVYYFHAEPKAFSGGALRLFAIGGKPDKDFVDIDPTHNTLAAFPSWVPHEVKPISAPSARFIDSRFAINCWIYGERRRQAEPINLNTGPH
jgi:SM-20-related protein